MLESWGSDVVVGLMAVLLGSMLRFLVLATPQQRREPAARRPGESWWASARRQAEEGARVADIMPASAKLAALAVYGLIAVIWVSVAVSPVEMRWLAFVAGLFVGLGIMELVFHAGKRTGGAAPTGPH